MRQILVKISIIITSQYHYVNQEECSSEQVWNPAGNEIKHFLLVAWYAPWDWEKADKENENFYNFNYNYNL